MKKKARSKWYESETLEDVDSANDLALLESTTAESQLNCLKWATKGIGL